MKYVRIFFLGLIKDKGKSMLDSWEIPFFSLTNPIFWSRGLLNLKGNKIVPVNLEDAVSKLKTVDMDLYEIAKVFFGKVDIEELVDNLA